MRFYLSQSGVRVPKLLFMSIAAFVAAVLTVTMLPSDAIAVEPASAKSETAEKIDSRPDRVSAMSTAQQQKSRVEDLSARTPTSSTFANKDGSWTVVSTAGPTRTENADGKWVDIDSDVTRSGDGYAPKASAYDVSFSNGDDKNVGVATSPSGDTVGVGWPSELPAPKADGDMLTYPDAADGNDLVVTSLPDGFQYSVVLDEAPTADAEPIEFRVPLKISGAKATVNEDGSVAVKDGKRLIASMSAPIMWDGAEGNVDGKGEVLPVTTTVDDSADDPILVLTPDMAFLTDPATVYPVVVDPTVSLTVAADTWVQSAGDTSSQSTSPELLVGSVDGGTTSARSYVYFDVSSWSTMTSAQVSSAQLDMTNFVTGACSGSPLTMSRVTGSWNISTMTWASQPAVTSDGAASSSQSYGATGCAAQGVVSFDATQVVKDWVGGSSNLGVRIAADNETALSGWRKFKSQNGSPTTVPKLTMTYNSSPNVPGTTEVEPAVSDGSTQLSSSPTPSFSTVVSDPDGSQVTGQFKLLQGTTVIDSGDVGPVPSGSRVYRKPTADVPDGTYTAQWRADDGASPSAWSTPVTVVVDHTAPAAPTIACTSTAANTWYDTRPATTSTCTVAAASGTADVSATLNGVDVEFPSLVGGTTSKSFTLPTNGLFDLKVIASDSAANAVTKGYTFGIGTGSLTSPSPGARSTNQFTIGAASKSGAYSAQVQWRLAGNTTWVAATQVKQGLLPWPGVPTNQGTMSVTGDLNWNAAGEAGALNPSLVEARFCFNYTASPTQRCTAVTEVSLVPHAFGGAFPTAQMGPASVSLQTGEFQVDAADVSMPGFGDDIGLSRTYQSFGAPASAAQGVFGPGWIANLEGPGEGFGAAQVIDRTATNGTISLLDSDGDASIYRFKTGNKTPQAVGVYVGQGAAAAYNEKLELKTGTPKTLVLTESDGTVTTWSFAGSNLWKVLNVVNPTPALPTTYSYTADDLVSGIYAGVPGVTCTEATQNRGCHALLLTYSTIGSDKRLSQVDLRTWDPAAASGAGAMTTTTVEKYAYDASGRLISEYDPRADTTSGHLTTSYTYQTVGGVKYLASMTPPAEKTWNFNLNSNATLDTVTRAQDSAIGGTATWRTLYSVPLSGTGLPNLTASAVSRWYQRTAPDYAAAVFGPDASGTSDMKYADISYFTKSGQTTNSANYGAGEWQIESQAFDQFGNETWSLSAQALDYGLKNGWNRYALNFMLSTLTRYNAAGTRVEYELGPQRYVIVEDGTGHWARPRTDTIYDDEASAESVPVPGRPTPSANPDDPKPNIVVEERDYVTAWDGTAVHAPGAQVWDIHKTRYRYDKVVSTDGDGWKLQAPTRISEQLGAGWSTSLNRFDTYGRILETRTPEGVAAVDGAGTDARSTVNTYFTADASSPVAACRTRPELLGLVCQTGPAASTGAVPTTTLTGFDYLQNPTLMIETSGSMTRTTTSTYDAVGRHLTQAVSVSGAPSGDLPSATTTFAYSPANGALQSTTTSSGSVDTTYDTWGRPLTQTDGAGNTSTTTYDAAGRVKTFNDGKGVYTYTYDGNDSTGREERRGMVTKMTAGLASGPDEFKAAYDAAGNQTQALLPNGVVQDNTFDITGQQLSVGYSRNGTVFLGEATNVDIAGRVRIALSTATYRTYSYDGRDRLTKAEDYAGFGCITRAYSFSLDSNRTSLATSAPAAGGACSTSSPVTQASTFGADDTLTNAGYIYDAFGRTRSLPAIDTDQPTGGALTATYFGHDMVAKLSQTTAGVLAEKAYTLDALGRIGETTSTTAGVDLRKSTNHYDSEDDSPAWTTEQTRPNASTAWASAWTRNVVGIGGDLSILQKSDGTSKIQLSNLHGDIISTMDNSSTGSAALENYTDSSEYGIAEAAYPTLGLDYEWLGAKQRSGDTVGGLVLMGARLYNPITGRFLTRDSVPGGGDNAYAYPTDPINEFDLTGEWWSKKKWKKLGRKALKGAKSVGKFVVKNCGYIPGPVGGGCSTAKAIWAIAHGDTQGAMVELAGIAGGGVGRAAAKKALKKVKKPPVRKHRKPTRKPSDRALANGGHAVGRYVGEQTGSAIYQAGFRHALPKKKRFTRWNQRAS